MAMLEGKKREYLEKQMEKANNSHPESEEAFFKPWRSIFSFIIKTYMKIVYRSEVVGLENVPADGSFMASGSHQSFGDVPLLHFTLTGKRRWINWVGRESLMSNRIAAWLFPALAVIPVDTAQVEPATIKLIFKRIKEGKPIGIFPQGTRCKTPEAIANTVPKSGSVSFAHRNKIPVLPVGFEGTFKPFTKIKLVIGEPYYIQPDKKRLTNDEMMAETILLLEKSYALVGKDYPLKNKAELTGGILEDYA